MNLLGKVKSWINAADSQISKKQSSDSVSAPGAQALAHPCLRENNSK